MATVVSYPNSYMSGIADAPLSAASSPLSLKPWNPNSPTSVLPSHWLLSSFFANQRQVAGVSLGILSADTLVSSFREKN